MNKPFSIFALGIMSGTSLDGLDLALCKFHRQNQQWQYEIIGTRSIDYAATMKQKLKNADKLSAREYFFLNNEFANFIADSVNAFLKAYPVKPDLIASHGHTVFHQPEFNLTVQLGNGAVIAAKTGITTICDFRTTDVALCGQGAPLVPIGDKLLFTQFDACLNLGGISNISYNVGNKRIAYDISVCNMALNEIVQTIGLTFDKDGDLARQGKSIFQLKEQLSNLSYYSQKPPKSLGREWFESYFLPLLKPHLSSVNDLLFTVNEHIATQIASTFHDDWNKVLVTGGGAKNKFLIETIQQFSSVPLHLPDEETIDFKESIIFAFLGVLRFCKEVNCLKEVTGASSDCCGGAIYFMN